MKFGREIAVFAGAAIVVIVVQAALLGGFDLLARPLWFDECLTWLLASDPSFTHEMRALHGGVDTNMPGLYVMLRPLHWIGGVSAEALRWFALVSAAGALVAVYALIRRFARPEVAVAGALLVWAHPLVMMHAFEGRFYAPLLAASTLLALALSARNKWWIAAGSVLLCGVHYFGVIVLGLMIAGALLSRRWKLREVWTAGFGVLVTITCLPFYLGQRSSFVATDWMDPLSVAGVFAFGKEIVPLAVVVIVGVMAVIGRLSANPHPDPLPEYRERGKDALTLSIALLTMPLVLLLVSLVWQPVLMGRYAIVVVLAIAVLSAWVMKRAPRWVAIGACALLFGLSCWEMARIRQFQLMATARIALIVSGIERSGADLAVFESGFDALPVWVNVPELRDRVRVLEGTQVSRKAEVVRGQMRNIAKFYAGPKWIRMDDAPAQLVYVPWEDVTARTLPAGDSATQINAFVFVVERQR